MESDLDPIKQRALDILGKIGERLLDDLNDPEKKVSTRDALEFVKVAEQSKLTVNTPDKIKNAVDQLKLLRQEEEGDEANRITG